MDILEFLIPAAVALLILATAITLAVLTIIAWVRSRRLGELTRRIERLERRVEQLLASGAPAADITAGMPSPSARPLAPPSPEQRLVGGERPPPIVTAATVEAKVVSGAEVAAAGAEPIGQPINWELLSDGERSVGWRLSCSCSQPDSFCVMPTRISGLDRWVA